MSTFTIGEHNLHDEFGKPTYFADVLLFCEAITPTIRARVITWVAGLRVLSPKDQPDLCIVLPRKRFRITERQYFRAHKGIAKVTPRRGTYVVKTIERTTGRKVAFVCEHRINAAFPPFKRGEDKVRPALWRKHTDMTLSIIDGLKTDNYTIFAGGDLNVPPAVKGYEGHLHEERDALDRLACTRDAALSNFERLSPEGSDHHRIKATATL